MMPSAMIRPALMQMAATFGQNDQTAHDLVSLVHTLQLPAETLMQLHRVGVALARELETLPAQPDQRVAIG